MGSARSLVALAIPATVVISSFLHARAVAALVEATAAAPPVLAAPPAFALPSPMQAPKSAEPILARNPFEHGARAMHVVDVAETPVACEGVRALVVVRGEDEDASLVALDVAGRRLVRRRGQDAGDLTVAWVGADRAWLVRGDRTCEARVFGVAAPPPESAPEPKRVAGIVRVSPSEVHVDRAALDRLLESPGELTKIRAVPDASGVRIMKVPPNSVIGLLGIQEGDRLVKAGGLELTSPERIMELYARLRSFDRLAIVVERAGRPVQMDYVIR